MKAAIHNPYLDSLGGGERYTLAIATSLLSMGYEVDIEWKGEYIKNKLEERFGINISRIKFVEDIKRGNGYEVCFWVSDGSIPLLYSRKNLLHFQVPFKDVNGRTLLNKMKFIRINKVICNSNFTKEVIDKEYGVKSVVLYPPVDVISIKPLKKKNQILYVGRFSRLEQSKHQDVLIEAFREFYTHGGKEWNLILAGGTDVGVGDYIEKLGRRIEDFPIEIIQSPDFPTLKKFYGESKIFWSAAGYGVDETKNPRKTEHFGMTLVESMAAGCIPFGFDAGGHKEIITDGRNGFLWQSPDDLIKKTKQILEDKKRLQNISLQSQRDSKKYSYDRFKKEVMGILV